MDDGSTLLNAVVIAILMLLPWIPYWDGGNERLCHCIYSLFEHSGKFMSSDMSWMQAPYHGKQTEIDSVCM